MFVGIRCNFCGLRLIAGWYDHSRDCAREVARQREESERYAKQVADALRQEAEEARKLAEKRRAYRRAEGFID